MNGLPYFPFYPADYLSDERVIGLSIVGEGCYIRMLCFQWREGSIPADRSAIVMLCKGYDGPGIDEAMSLFIIDARTGRLFQKRLRAEMEKLSKQYKLKKIGGIEGAKRRWHTNRIPNGIPNGLPLGKSGYSDSDSNSNIRTIVELLNLKAGKNFKPGNKVTVRHIKARLAEGFTVDDFMAVLEIKVAQWKDDPKMAPFLRPETLFGTKFEGYLNEAPGRGRKMTKEEYDAARSAAEKD
jgi:uncharacterized phage protein (TIGR02220 family)